MRRLRIVCVVAELLEKFTGIKLIEAISLRMQLVKILYIEIYRHDLATERGWTAYFFQRCLHAAFLLSIFLLAENAQAESSPLQVPIKIGVIVPLTGEWATWGAHIRDALELYRTAKIAVLPMEFSYQDEANCDPVMAVSAYKFLREREHADIFIVGCVRGTEAIAPAVKRDGALLFSVGVQQRKFVEQEGLLINFAFQVSEEVAALVRAMVESNIRRLGVLRHQGEDELVSELQKKFESQSVQLVEDIVVFNEEVDYSALLLKLRKSKSDGILLNLGESQLTLALSELRKMKWNVPVYSSYVTEVMLLNNPRLRTLAEGLRYTHPARRAESSEFERNFSERFGREPSINSLFVFDGLTLLDGASRSCGGWEDRKCLFQQIANGTKRVGLAGEYRIAPDGSIERTFELREIKDSKVVVVNPGR